MARVLADQRVDAGQFPAVFLGVCQFRVERPLCRLAAIASAAQDGLFQCGVIVIGYDHDGTAVGEFEAAVSVRCAEKPVA